MATDSTAPPRVPADPAPGKPAPINPSSAPELDLVSSNLFKIVSMMLLFISCLLVASLFIQAHPYRDALQAVLSGSPASANMDHSAVITYARGLDAAILKTSALFLGFILIFIGSLYVLRTAEAAYKLIVSGGPVQGALHTSSPGLVIVTLGVVLTVFVLCSKSDVDYQRTITKIVQAQPESSGHSQPESTSKPQPESSNTTNPTKLRTSPQGNTSTGNQNTNASATPPAETTITTTRTHSTAIPP